MINIKLQFFLHGVSGWWFCFQKQIENYERNYSSRKIKGLVLLTGKSLSFIEWHFICLWFTPSVYISSLLFSEPLVSPREIELVGCMPWSRDDLLTGSSFSDCRNGKPLIGAAGLEIMSVVPTSCMRSEWVIQGKLSSNWPCPLHFCLLSCPSLCYQTTLPS